MTISQLTANFANRVAGDGFYDIKRSKNVIRTILWVVIVLAAWTFFVLQCIVFTVKYFGYPVDTNSEIKFDQSVGFPAVTICNLNPIRFSRIAENFDMAEELERKSESGKLPPEIEREKWENLKEKEEKDIPKEVEIQKRFYENYFGLPENKQKNAGHQIETMMVECVWKGRQCYPSHFTYFHHPKYGNCYTFNAGWKWKSQEKKTLSAIKNTSLTGSNGGLQLMLLSQTREYVPLLASSTGVRVHIHHQSKIPYPEDSGITASAGFFTSLQLRKVVLKRLESPYNAEGCKRYLSENMNKSNAKSYWPRAEYSLTACMKYCYQNHLENQCKCVEPRLLAPAGKQPCLINNTAHTTCMNQVAASFRFGTIAAYCKAECPSPCDETEFQVKSAAAPWPNEYYQNYLKENFASRNPILDEILNSGDPRLIKFVTIITITESVIVLVNNNWTNSGSICKLN